jgi:Zn-dependent protease
LDQQLLFSLIAIGVVLLVAFPVHECAHAFAAYRLGDSTARYMGRLTLDPRRHLDPLGAGVLVISAFAGYFIGWAKPTPVNPINLDGGRRGEALVAAAGPLSNLVMAAIVSIPVRLVFTSPSLRATLAVTPVATVVYDIAWYFVLINLFLFVFNLLPIPPLDGWKVLTGLVDPRTAYTLRQYEQYAIFLLLAVFLLGGRFIAPIVFRVLAILTGDAQAFLVDF